MSEWTERPRDMRARDRDTFDFNASQRQTAKPVPGATTGRGRKLGGVDNGTVALAISSMAFYWMMPILMSRRRPRRRAKARQPKP